LEEKGAHCCKNASIPCTFKVKKTNRLVGCADPLEGEQCCGDAICTDGYKCCTIPNPTIFDTHPIFGAIEPPTNLNFTDINTNKICCPNGTFCCAKIVGGEIIPFCSRHENCTSFANLSESLQLTSALSIAGGFLPDYIESEGWLVDPIAFFSDAEPSCPNLEVGLAPQNLNVSPDCVCEEVNSKPNFCLDFSTNEEVNECFNIN
jgi:hypothetical protein